MKLTGNTILITGGGSGIGRGLAEALAAKGNKVIVAGRRREALDAVTNASPNIASVQLDVRDPADIKKVAKQLIIDYPDLNVLINNAGLMLFDDASGPLDDDNATIQIETNLLGSIRLSGALVEHLKTKSDATIIYNSSILAYTPLAMFATYSATKAALHSYAMSQRFKLKGTSVKVQEIAPPYVGTDLLGNPDDPLAMPLGAFIKATMDVLGDDSEELLVEEAKALRNNAGPNEHAFVNQFNEYMVAALSGQLAA